LALGNPDDARASFKTAENLTPDASGPVLAQAKLFLAERQFAAAEPLFERVLRQDPKSLEGRLGIIRLLRLNGRPEAALQDLDKLISERPGFLAARLERAEIHLLQDNQG